MGIYRVKLKDEKTPREIEAPSRPITSRGQLIFMTEDRRDTIASFNTERVEGWWDKSSERDAPPEAES